jgi:hypothetical protein
VAGQWNIDVISCNFDGEKKYAYESLLQNTFKIESGHLEDQDGEKRAILQCTGYKDVNWLELAQDCY